MNPEFLANLERCMRALVKLSAKLQEMNESPEFDAILKLYFQHGFVYRGPTWDAELKEALAALEEAKRLSGVEVL